MTPSPEIEPVTHWWKASAITTAPTLLHLLSSTLFLTVTYIFLDPTLLLVLALTLATAPLPCLLNRVLVDPRPPPHHHQ